MDDQLVKVNLKDLWNAYIGYIQGKNINPFLLCGCVTPKVTVYPLGYTKHPIEKGNKNTTGC